MFALRAFGHIQSCALIGDDWGLDVIAPCCLGARLLVCHWPSEVEVGPCPSRHVVASAELAGTRSVVNT